MRKLSGWPHVYVRKGSGTLYYVRRVPTDIEHLIDERQFKRSLRHRDHRLPAFKAAYDAVHHEVETYITQLRKGTSSQDIRGKYESAVALAQKLGFDYRPMHELADNATNIEDLVHRLIAIEDKISDTNSADVAAVLGTVSKPALTLSEALERYIDLHKTEISTKNEGQKKRWRNPYLLAVKYFIDEIGDKPLDKITREDALSFREWWVEKRVSTGETTANTANKNIMALKAVFRTINDTYRLNLDNPFDGLRVANALVGQRLPISRDWLENILLKERALARLNTEACGIIMIMADTGARLNEITGLEPADIILDHPVPHIIVRPNKTRSLKTAQSLRSIPLVGTALKAIKEHPNGFPRYAGKNASASAAINKYLKENSLLPEGATLYGLRHGFQDRLIEVEVPERIQADLMGHKTLRPKYGKGASLEHVRDWLHKTALKVNIKQKITS